MTIRIEVECDCRTCSNTRELDDYNDSAIKQIGWHTDHENGGHYCGHCWPEIEKEIAAEKS